MTRSTESGRIMLIRKEFAEDGVLIELYWNVNASEFYVYWRTDRY